MKISYVDSFFPRRTSDSCLRNGAVSRGEQGHFQVMAGSDVDPSGAWVRRPCGFPNGVSAVVSLIDTGREVSRGMRACSDASRCPPRRKSPYTIAVIGIVSNVQGMVLHRNGEVGCKPRWTARSAPGGRPRHPRFLSEEPPAHAKEPLRGAREPPEENCLSGDQAGKKLRPACGHPQRLSA